MSFLGDPGGSAVERLTERLRVRAFELGFTSFGVTTPDPTSHMLFYRRWLTDGFGGDMAYLARRASIARRADLRETMPTVRSVVVVGHHYCTDDPGDASTEASRGVVARYARGRDYHAVISGKLGDLGRWLDAEVPDGVAYRCYVDSGPILERDLARRAGLGWFGRNTMLIDPRRGSYFFLGILLVDVALRPSEPFQTDRCGTCRACLDACPTGALLGRDQAGAPVMDARRCISYLTIEHRGPIPIELRPAMGNRIYGCDICQEVCPWTQRFGAELGARSEYEAMAWPADREGEQPLPSLDGPDLVEFAERILDMSGKEYQRVFADSPLARPGRKRMLRNLCVALGNYGATSREAADRVRPVLSRAAEDRSELVREHAEWALRPVDR